MGQLIRSIAFLFAFVLVHTHSEAMLLDGVSLDPVALPTALSHVQAGWVVVVGEDHGTKPHHDNQRSVLAELLKNGHKVSVGLEFVASSFQGSLDQYLRGEIMEGPFLEAVEWGRISFANYRPQVNFPLIAGGWTIGLNVPRRISGRVRDVGIAGLNEEERRYVPDGFQIGNSSYRRRFNELMAQIPHPIPPEKRDQMFEAQSLWDDAMANTAKTYLAADPDQVLVIHVGNFHAAFGGGLPDRLRARGMDKILVFSQIDARELTDEELNQEIGPDPESGPRGDFIWITR